MDMEEDHDLMNICIKRMSGIKHEMTVPSDIMIEDLKNDIEILSEVSASIQRLIFQGRVLNNDQKLCDTGVESGDVVLLVESAPPPMPENTESPEPEPIQNNPYAGVSHHLSHLEESYPFDAVDLEEGDENQLNNILSRLRHLLPLIADDLTPENTETIGPNLQHLGNALVGLGRRLQTNTPRPRIGFRFGTRQRNGNGFQINIPVVPINSSGSRNSEPIDVNNIMQRMSTSLSGAGVNISDDTREQVSNLVSSVLQGVSERNAQNSAPTPTTENNSTSTSTNTPVNSNIGNMMSQLFSSFANANTAPTPTPPEGQNNQEPVTVDTGNLIASLFSSIQNSTGNSSMSAASTIRSMSGETGEDPIFDTDSALSPLNILVEGVGVTELYTILNGNWEVLEPLRENLASEIMVKIENDPDNIPLYTMELLEPLEELINVENLPADLRAKIKPGYDIYEPTLDIIRKCVMDMIECILHKHVATEEQQYPFSEALEEIVSNNLVLVVSHLEESMEGGIQDVSSLIKFWSTSALSFLGPGISQMATSTITSNLISSYVDRQIPDDGTDPVLNPPTPSSTYDRQSIPVEWREVIDRDTENQQGVVRQRPFSDSYSGQPNKKRKVEISLKKRLEDAMKNARVGNHTQLSVEDIAEIGGSSQLSDMYNDQISTDICGSLQSNPDFDPSRFTNSNVFIEGNEPEVEEVKPSFDMDLD
eukprot:TRINITY_DN11788_c0_g1_i1.p1 TRINITY_DN11788_c0_g1~~TRINITY_DN11788_c0_g1_i1.p1  ORF type:complete len:707 (-),score=201.94 TRINITY_DN11788_c0_g1_i1:51-2171(-)